MLNNYDKNYALDLLDVSRAGASMSPIGTTSSVTGSGSNPFAQLGGGVLAAGGAYGIANGGSNWSN
jgi:hypothetical protein